MDTGFCKRECPRGYVDTVGWEPPEECFPAVVLLCEECFSYMAVVVWGEACCVRRFAETLGRGWLWWAPPSWLAQRCTLLSRCSHLRWSPLLPAAAPVIQGSGLVTSSQQQSHLPHGGVRAPQPPLTSAQPPCQQTLRPLQPRCCMDARPLGLHSLCALRRCSPGGCTRPSLNLSFF